MYVAAFAIPTVIAAVDAAVHGDAVLISLLGIGPFIAAALLGRMATVTVSAYVLALAAALGVPDDIWGTTDHLTRMGGLGVSCVAAVVLAALRAQRDESLQRVTRVAEIAQRAILRPVPAHIGPIHFAARYHSATAEAEIGGDLYDVALTPWGLRAIVGDVRGKGIDGISLAALTLGAFRESAFAHAALRDVAAGVDARVSAGLGPEDFVTVVVVEFDVDNELEVVTMGHLPPVVCGIGGIRVLAPSVVSTPVGLEPTIVVDRFPLLSGERLLLYTDGLIEGRNDTGAFFDLDERLPRCMEFESVETWADWLVGEALAHVGGSLADDLALLVAEVGHGTFDVLEPWLRPAEERLEI
jgi:serine phosphatase RsbU (regulator of sigma subunit)